MIDLALLKRELNPPQLEAATTTEGPLLILAGAGSGKTKTITYRMAYMLEVSKLNPKNILAITFTNKAAQEMRNRVFKLVPYSRAQGMTLSTFHALGVNILREDITHLGMQKNFTIYDTSDQMSLVREALHHYRGGKALDRKQVQAKLSWLKNCKISAAEFPQTPHFDDADPYDHALLHTYTYYQDKMRFYNAIDFDDILFLTLELFERVPELAVKYSERFRYIMIDEYQDTNSLQFQLVQHLTKTHHNLCVVGDDDQAIYGFRGADVSNILQFEKQFPEAKVIKLEQNYRSTLPILNLANKVIEQNPRRKEKKLWSTRDSAQLPLLWATADGDHEAQIVVDDITKYQAQGQALSEVAILFRSNTQTTPFEDQLRMSQIPYKMVGGQKFYDKKEIKDLIAYLCVIQNPSDAISLRRILNVPARGIGTTTLENFLKISQEKRISLFSAIERFGSDAPTKVVPHLQSFAALIRQGQEAFNHLSLSKAIEQLISLIRYDEFIEKSYTQVNQVVRRKNDLNHFVESARRFEKYHDNPKLAHFLERVLLQDSQDNQNDKEEETAGNEVTLMTLHSSKGLEFKRVYLVGMEEEILPHKKTIGLGQDISEECRLCYVGITRARENLIMTYAKERTLYGKKTERHPSRFVAHVAHDLMLRQDRTSFGHMSETEVKEYKKNFFEGLISSLD